MKRNMITIVTLVLVFTLFHSTVFAHGSDKNVKLHINPRWKECSFQLDAALTQQVWREFTNEAGLVAYFRPLKDAQPIGAWNYEFSILQWNTAFNDRKSAWNDTFVHPDSVHYLKDGERLGFPALTLRTGITDKMDVGVYWMKSPGANYGFWGGQFQYNIMNDAAHQWAASARVSFATMYGPQDFDLNVYGIDLLASKRYAVYSDWISMTTYAGVSTYLTRTHETSAVVNLNDENVAGVQGMVGVTTQLSMANIAIEYNVATVSTLSFKIGVGF